MADFALGWAKPAAPTNSECRLDVDADRNPGRAWAAGVLSDAILP